MSDIDYTWQSTPQLWMATRTDYDGAPDSKSRHMMGFGKTKEAAAADLIEQEQVSDD